MLPLAHFAKIRTLENRGGMPWDEDDPEYITCPECGKHFILTPIYDFRGWRSEPDENYYDEDENVF